VGLCPYLETLEKFKLMFHALCDRTQPARCRIQWYNIRSAGTRICWTDKWGAEGLKGKMHKKVVSPSSHVRSTIFGCFVHQHQTEKSMSNTYRTWIIVGGALSPLNHSWGQVPLLSHRFPHLCTISSQTFNHLRNKLRSELSVNDGDSCKYMRT